MVAQPGVIGYGEYQARRESRQDGADLSAQLLTLRVDTASYLVEPWIADVSAGLGLTFSKTSEDGLSQTGEDITGGARLRLLPRSIFPFEAFAERRDSRVDGELIGPSYTQSVYGFSQTYAPPGGTRYILNYRHTDRAEERPGLTPAEAHSSADFVGLAFNRSLRSHSLDARADYDTIDRDNPRQTDTRTIGVLRHRYNPGTTFSVDSLFSAVQSRLEEQAAQTRVTQQQLSSNLFWRPETSKPLLVSGSMLLSGFEQEYGASATRNELILLSGSATYQYTTALSSRASASVSDNHTAAGDNLTSLAKIGLTYAPAEIPLKGFHYRYAASLDLGNRTDEASGSTQELSAALSQGLSRSTELWSGIAGAALTQELTTVRDTAERTEDSLAHTATADWSALRSERSLFLRALASDTRRIDGSNIAFQLVNLQAAGTMRQSRVSSWSGNLTVQATRSTADGRGGPWLESRSANLVYQHERAFRVPLLRFVSELRLLSDDLLGVTASGFETEQRATWSWSNRFDYTIGRVQLSLRGLVSEVDGRGYRSVFFVARRYFGRMPQ